MGIVKTKYSLYNPKGKDSGGPPLYLFREIASKLNMTSDELMRLRSTYRTKFPFPKARNLTGSASNQIGRWAAEDIKPWIRAVRADLEAQVAERKARLTPATVTSSSEPSPDSCDTICVTTTPGE